MSSVQLYPISKEAENWRDLDSQLIHAELALKISLVATILIVVAAMAVSSYYCAITTRMVLFRGEWFTLNNSGFIAIPAILGSALITCAAVGLCFSNFERNINGHSLSHHEAPTLIKLLTQGQLKEIHAEYYKRNGGLKSLVHKGYLLQEQADRLRELLKNYDQDEELANKYTTQFFTSKAIQENRYPADYAEICCRRALLNHEWIEISQEIEEQYFGEIKTQRKKTTVAPHILSNPTLMEPTAEASGWRDLDPSERMYELAFRVALISVVLICLAGIAVSIYFWTQRYITFPAVGVGIFGAVGFSIWLGVQWNYERVKNGFEQPNNSHVRDDRVLMLTEGTFQEVYERFYQQNGGLGPFVRQGYLTVEQGDELRKLFRHYEKNMSDLRAYDINAELVQEVIQHPEKSASYQALQKRKDRIEKRWKTLRKNIKPTFEKKSLNYLPSELVQHIFSYLPVDDLKNVEKIPSLNAIAQKAFQDRAEKYELPIVNPKESLKKYFKQIVTLVEEGYVPKECLVYKKGFIFSEIDAEATLKKLSDALAGEEAEEIKWELGRALVTYCTKPNFQMVKTLVKLGANLEVRNERGSTPLMLAIYYDHDAQIAEFLISKGADVITINQFGVTPLHQAAYSNSFVLAKLLLERGAAITLNQRNQRGYTPLHCAAEHNNINMVSLFLNFGAEKNLVDHHHRTAADFATDQRVKEHILNFERSIESFAQ